MGADNHLTVDMSERMDMADMEREYARPPNRLTASETRQKARKATKYNLYELVGQEAEEWSDERREREAWESAEIIVSESQHSHPEIWDVIHDRTITLVINDMARVPMSHLSTNDISHVVWSLGYRPNGMNISTIWGMVAHSFEENPYQYPEYHTRACSDVKDGIVQKLTDY